MKKIQKIFLILSFVLFNLTNVNSAIKDGLFITIGDKAITSLDIVNEIKVILILNNLSYSDDKKQELQDMAVKSAIRRNIKTIEIERYDLSYKKNDLNVELARIAGSINMDIDTLKNICQSNGLDFGIIENQIKTELLWNSLIFNLYKDRISINTEEIDEQLKFYQTKEEIDEYNISEIVIKPIEKEKLNAALDEIKNKIKTEGFENVAIASSIAASAPMGGDLGWLNENKISKKFKSEIFSTPIGSITDPIILNEGILFFYIKDKRKIKNDKNLEQLKEELVQTEKTKILNMYALTHYDNLRRAASINFLND
jgi:peptidyl-prolyl cis-trans isomerase SurA